MMKRCLSMILLLGLSIIGYSQETARIVEVKKIWDQAPHNAFTDLIRFQGKWFCVFREGQGHVSPDGALRVIESVDGASWESAALIKSPNSDLRDAKITTTPDGRLMLSGAEALHDKSQGTHQSLAWFSSDGRNWTERVAIGDRDYWLWRTTWNQGRAYAIGYSVKKEKSIRLYSSQDGRMFETLVDSLMHEGYPNETSIVFDKENAYCLLRQDGSPNHGMLGSSRPPYKDWKWKDIGARIGGPQMMLLPDGRLVAAVRLYDGGARTSLVWIDRDSGKLEEFLKLPSGGDTSYAGLVFHEGRLWISYYSSHEGKTSIYLAKVELPIVKRTIGNRLELFVDDFLVSRATSLKWKQHFPEAHDVALVCDQPWEGNTSAYYTLFADGDRFRMYYRGSHFDETLKKSAHPEYACYAESRDGLKWEKPKLGLFEVEGSKENNIVWAGIGSHNFTPFRDGNPRCSPEERYKALAGNAKGLMALKSSDGVRWEKMQEGSVLTDGAFDSQNLAFWDSERNEYRAYWRYFERSSKVRAIRTATSKDFLKWENQNDLSYVDSPDEHLYTNAIGPYFRAPHLFIGFPTRFQPKHEQVEPIFMSSRDGKRFKRWPDALIPITAPKDRDGNRSNYMTSGLLRLPGNEKELSVYATEAYYAGPASRVRRFSLRVDGFVSLHADAVGGELVTHPIRVDGDRLILNAKTEGKGSIQVELQDSQGRVREGFSRTDCVPLQGDSIEFNVQWKQGLATLRGEWVRFRFLLKDADLYSMQIQ